MERIPVVFTPDENFIVPTSVAIMSMLQSKLADTSYIFYIVIEEKFNESKLEILSRLKTVFCEFEYCIVKIDAAVFAKAKVTIRHITANTYYRLILAEVLPFDKCMYHDGDILVLNDLSEMYNVSLEHNYIAGIKAISKQQNTDENQAFIKKWGFVPLDNYIIGGNLIINLQEIRNQNKTQQFIEQMNKGYPEQDQDVINRCCYGKIVFLPLKYGMLNRWTNSNALKEYDRKVYTDKEIEEAINEPAVIHCAGADTKPWCNLRVVYAKQWWAYAKVILRKEEYDAWYRNAEHSTERRDWHCFINHLKRGQKLIIFGFSEISKKLTDLLLKNGYSIECFLDNDSSKQGKIYRGYTVKALADIIEQKDEFCVIITSQNYRRDIRKQLSASGIKECNLIDYYDKGTIYYQVLDEKYYIYELKDICLREFGYCPMDIGSELIQEYLKDVNLQEKYYFRYWLNNI